MTATNPRAWLQLRLATCIIGMFVAAALLYLNVVGREGERQSIGKYPLSSFSWLRDPRDVSVECFSYPKSFGWPWEYRFEQQLAVELPEGAVAYDTDGPQWRTRNENIKWDVGVAVCILLSAVVATEWFSRRRRSPN